MKNITLNNTIDGSSLSIEEKVGQLFFIGIPTGEFDNKTTELLKRVKPGGVCLFARNTKQAEQIRELLEKIRENLVFEPFLSIDQEGGLVDRLRRIVEPMPSAKEVSKAGNVKTASELAKITAETIRILGFNMNFAPVIDVTDDSRNGFIMDTQARTFGNTKDEVTDFTTAYLEALQKGGALGCVKHFPGIGAVEFDPHEELPTVGLCREELFELDLVPYINHFKNGNVFAIMTGHTTFPSFDLQETDTNGKLLPSSLSQKIVTNLLRDELNFENLALTDDLEMGAIINNYGIGEASKMAVKAGNDFLLICNDSKSVYED